MEIVAATPQDLEQMVEVEGACFSRGRYSRRMLHYLLTHPYGRTFFGLEGGKVVGAVTILLSPEIGLARLVSIATVPEHRGRGIARMLLHKAQDTALAEGSRLLTLEVATTNLPALNLYLKEGFHIQGTIPDYYGRHRNAFYMEKPLGTHE